MFRLLILLMFAGLSVPSVFAEEKQESVLLNNIYPFPLTYREKPMGFSETPYGYQDPPLGFREKSNNAIDVPLGFREKPADQLDAPRGFSENPRNFIEKDSHPQANQDPENQLDAVTHSAANNDPLIRVSIEDDPKTKLVVYSDSG